MKPNVFSVTIWLATLVLLASCAPAAPPTPTAKVAAPKVETPVSKPSAPSAPSPSPKPATGQPQYGGILTIPAVADAPDLDIHQQVSAATFALVGPAYSGILQYDPLRNDKVVPDLAERWEASPDSKVYTFHLRKGVKWHDGQPFTSSDVKASIERLQGYSGLKAYVESVAGIERIDTPNPETITVALKQPEPDYPTIVAHGRIQVGAKHVIEAKGNLKWDIVGTGPFRFKEYNAGVGAILTKNDGYFIKGRPYLDGITFYIIKDAATRLAAFRAGRVKMVGVPPEFGITASQADTLAKAMPNAVVMPFQRTAGVGLMPNPTKAPWSDVRVRRAAFLAVDRQRAVELIAEGLGGVGLTMVYGGFALPQEELLKMPGLRQPKDADVAEARKLMEEAGHGKGLKTSVLVRAGYPEYEKTATFFRDQLGKIGIDLELVVMEYSAWLDRRAKLNYDTMVLTNHLDVAAPSVSSRYLTRKYGGQFSALDDEKTIELLQKQAQATNLEERKKLVRELQYRVAESVPHILACQINARVAISPDVRDYLPGLGIYNNSKLQDVWLAR